MTRDDLPDEGNWDKLLDFNFTNAQLLSLSKIMGKTDFRAKAMQATKRRIIVEKD